MNTLKNKPINRKPKIEDHIKTANLDILEFSGSDFKIDSLEKLASYFVIVYDAQQNRWSLGKERRSELMNAMKEWICYNFHIGTEVSVTNVVVFLRKLTIDLRQRFLIDICEGFGNFMDHYSISRYTGVQQMCIQFVKNRVVFNEFFRDPYKNWNSFHAYPGNFLLYATIGNMKKIVSIFVDCGFYELYFDHILTLPGNVENIVEQTCRENGWTKIVEKLQT